MTNFLEWSWAGQHVQTEIENGEYLSSESTLVLAGPSRLTHLTGNDGNLGAYTSNSLFPLGLLQNASFAQNRQVTRLFEIGSKRAYFVPGRMFANFNIGRVMFYGPSLMRMLYALAPSTLLNFGGQPLSSDVAIPADYLNLFPTTQLFGAPGAGGLANEAENRDFFINLASELFNIPFGLVMIFKDTRNRLYGGTYLEDCYIEAHQMGVDSNSVIIAESVTGQFDSVAPIQLVQP